VGVKSAAKRKSRKETELRELKREEGGTSRKPKKVKMKFGMSEKIAKGGGLGKRTSVGKLKRTKPGKKGGGYWEEKKPTEMVGK